MLRKIIAIVLSFNLILAQSGFCQGAFELNLGQYLGQMNSGLTLDKFCPLHLRYFSYDTTTSNFQLLLDKGDNPDIKDEELQDKTKVLMEYFRIGLSLSNDKFWVNLRPDSEDEIIDPLLERTDLGKVMLESDLQLKKDTAAFTSPQSPEGRLYWDKLYQKAGELFGSEPANIPALTRPWIVPGEIIVKETDASAYIYKANMKVMLEEDYLKTTNPISSGQMYTFSDPRMKELNAYSTQLIREMLLPKLTKEVNTAKRYAALRQVFFSLVMARWFKERFRGKPGEYPQTIDSNNLEGLTSKEPWSKSFYFNEYKKSFEKGEYNLKEQVSTISGQVIRSYVSGGEQFGDMQASSFNSVSSPLGSQRESAWWRVPILATMITAAGLPSPYSSEGKECSSGKCIQIEFGSPKENPSASQYSSGNESAENRRVNSFNRALQAADILYSLYFVYSSNPNSIRIDSPNRAITSFLNNLGAMRYRDGGTTEIFLGNKQLLFHETPWRPKEYKFIVSKKTNGGDAVIFTDDGNSLIVSTEDRSIQITRTGEREQYTFVVKEVKDEWSVYHSTIMTYAEIDRRINEIPKSDRPYIGFQLRRGSDGLPVLTIKQHEDIALKLPRSGKDVEFDANDIIDFFAKEGKIYVYTLGEVPGTFAYIEVGRNWYNLWKAGEAPQYIKDFFNRRGKSISVPSSGSSPVVSEKKAVGGIDFRQMDMLIQPMGSFSGLNFSLPVLSAATLEAMDLDKELEDIRNMAKAGMIPSGERVKEYLAACFQKGRMAEKQDDLLLCLSEICRLQEEEVLETSPELRESLVIVETGNFVLSS